MQLWCHNLLTPFPTLDVVVNIEQPSYTVGEFESSLNICAVLDRPAERNVTVTLATREEIARGICKMLGVSSRIYCICILTFFIQISIQWTETLTV